MTFNEYFEKIQRQISRASSLEDLLVWRKRINIGIAGLPYKANKGCLVAHCYTSNCTGQVQPDTFLREFSYIIGDKSPLAECSLSTL